MNPNSNYYLAFNTGFPNAYDRAWGYTGSELMVHGDCSSRGCYAMTDEQIQEIYALARESFFGGQKEFQFEAFPFRMTALNMAKHRNNPNFAFWKMIKEGYDDFEATHQEPKVAVCEKRYVFDAAAPDDSTKPLKFDPRGKCPVYQLDKTVADAVLDHRRQEQFQMAQYIAENVATAPPHVGDGGMNPVFANKLASHDEYDNNGRASRSPAIRRRRARCRTFPIRRAPMPRCIRRSRRRNAQQRSRRLRPRSRNRPVMLASVPVPPAAPLPKEGEAPAEKPTTIAGLLGNLFGGSQAEAKPAAPDADSEPVALRGSEDATKPKPAVSARRRRRCRGRNRTTCRSRSSAWHAEAATNAAPPKPSPMSLRRSRSVARAEKSETQGAPPRAKSAPPIRRRNRRNNLLAGAQPVVPVGSFDSPLVGVALTLAAASPHGLLRLRPRQPRQKPPSDLCRLDQRRAAASASSTMPARARARRAGALWVLLHSEWFPDRAQAMSREWHLKRDRALRKKLALALPR